MPLETATYIDALDANYPASDDSASQGDNHIRLIKAVLKASFPAIAGPVTLTDAEINSLLTDSNTYTDLYVTELKKHIVPKGTIQMWSGSVGTIPTGWGLCDGTTYDGLVSPDLRGQFIIGAGQVGSGYVPGDTGGDTTKTSTSNTTGISAEIGSTVLTVAQVPAHRHKMFADISVSGADSAPNQQKPAGNEAIAQRLFNTSGSDYEMSRTYRFGDPTPGAVDGIVSNVGEPSLGMTGKSTALDGTVSGGEGHSHAWDLTDDGHTHDVNVLPPYYSLCFIIKYVDYVEPTP